jgi:hypothetical protein
MELLQSSNNRTFGGTLVPYPLGNSLKIEGISSTAVTVPQQNKCKQKRNNNTYTTLTNRDFKNNLDILSTPEILK